MSTPLRSTRFRRRPTSASCLRELRLARSGMRGVRELPKLPGQQVGDLLADVHGVISDPLERTRDKNHPQAVLAHPRRPAELENPLDYPPVGSVDELVQLDEHFGAR